MHDMTTVYGMFSYKRRLKQEDTCHSTLQPWDALELIDLGIAYYHTNTGFTTFPSMLRSASSA